MASPNMKPVNLCPNSRVLLKKRNITGNGEACPFLRSSFVQLHCWSERSGRYTAKDHPRITQGNVELMWRWSAFHLGLWNWEDRALEGCSGNNPPLRRAALRKNGEGVRMWEG